MKVIGHYAVYVNVGLLVNLPDPAGTLEDTLDNASLIEPYIAPVISLGLWFFIILDVGIWLLSFDADRGVSARYVRIHWSTKTHFRH